jgi:SOS-response transcriptional repressor LexA
MTENIREIQVENQLLMQEITRMFNTKGKESVTITVRGYSMRPFLEDRRDKVTLTPPRTPRIGDVVLARIADKRYALHRVIKSEGERYIMRGDGNPLYMKESFTEKDIIGVAHTFIRKGKPHKATGFVWRCYSFTWRVLKPFRRILLGIYRRLP